VLYDYELEGTFPNGIHRNEFNNGVKIIAEMAGLTTRFSEWKVIGNNKIEVTLEKYKFISSHTCRRSFCTNQFLAGMPTILIRIISGHADERSFLKYIMIDEEEAAKKMLEIWRK
jgi:GH15 family glucan-1,4-alpha-glucosidase